MRKLAEHRSTPQSIWSAAIPTAMLFVGAGLALEPSKASIFLYIASVLCAGSSVVRFIVNDIKPKDMCANNRLAPDEEPRIETTRAIKV